jgi:hypothetical protein
MTAILKNNQNTPNRDYFLLAIRNWDHKLENYMPVGDPSTVTESFSEYPSAETAYFATNYSNCLQAGGKDVKIELLHMRFGIAHIVRNRILFP